MPKENAKGVGIAQMIIALLVSNFRGLKKKQQGKEVRFRRGPKNNVSANINSPCSAGIPSWK